jgi:hypothetical protein
VRLEDPDRLRAADASVEDFDEAFVSSWREELLAKAWEALREIERDAGRPYYAFLRARSENPAYTSAQLAAVLTAERAPDEPYTAAGVREVLQRARERFAQALVAEVEFSVSSSSSRDVTDELIELGLLEYCKPVLEKGEHPS